MIAGTLILVALLLGYFVAVGLSMIVTIGVAQAAPDFVAKDHLLRNGYKFFQALVWLVSVTAGSYVSAWIGELAMRPWFVGTLLAGALVFILWYNAWETRQRGLGHQLLMSAITVAGVGAGVYLAVH